MYFHFVDFDKKFKHVDNSRFWHSMFIVETCFLLKMNTIQIYYVKFSVFIFLCIPF